MAYRKRVTAKFTANGRGTKWCFSEFGDAAIFYSKMGALYEKHKSHIRYICGQLEKVDTVHVQGYIQLFKTQRMSWLKNNVSSTAHFEKQNAEVNAKARDYCFKEKSRISPFIEFGTFCKGSGMRTDIIAFKDEIIKGRTQRDLLDDYTIQLARFPKFYHLVRSLHRPIRTKDLVVRLNYGGTGLGKTRYAYDNFRKLYVMPLSSGTAWFNGYDMEETVLLDDFTGASSKVSLNFTLQLLDRYPVQVQIKGSFTWWMPYLIIITSNIHPRRWYDWSDREGQYAALMRRITEIFYYEKGEDERGLQGDDRKEFIEQPNYGKYN